MQSVQIHRFQHSPTIDFSENSLVLRTYDYNGNKYADDYTLYKTSDNLSRNEFDWHQAKNIKNDGYTDETWNKLQSETRVQKS